MDGINRISTSQSKSPVESVQAAQEYALEYNELNKDERDRDDELDPRSEKSKLKKAGRELAKSVALLDDERSLSEFVKGSAKKMAVLEHERSKDSISEKLKQQIEENIEELFTQGKLNTKDKVKLSEQALASKSSDVTKEFNLDEADQPDELTKRAALSQEAAKETEQKTKRFVRQQSAEISAHKQTEEAVTSGRQVTENAIRRYLKEYAKNIIKENSKQAEQTRYLKESVLNLGVPTKQLTAMEQGVQSMIKRDLKNRMKDSFIELSLNFQKKASIDLIRNHDQYVMLEKLAEQKGVFTAGTTTPKDIKEEARSDMRAFLTQDLDETIASEKAKGASLKDINKVLNRYTHLSYIINFNPNEYLKTVGQKLDNLGLNQFENPNPNQGFLDTDTSGQGQSRQQNQEQIVIDEDSASIEDQLRSLYMQKSMKQDLKSTVELNWKLNRLKSKALKSGAITEAGLKKLEEEGKGFAKLRLVNLLKESFEERATQADPKSTEAKNTRKKMKMAISGLKKLGEGLSKSELKEIRDEINRGMFTVIKEHYLQMRTQSEAIPSNTGLKLQADQYESLLSRLKTESGIQEEINPAMFQKKLQSKSNIVEAA